SHGGSVRFSDPGTTQYYTKDDATGPTVNGVKFSPAGGSFRTETQTVKVSLESGSVSGWYQVEGKDRVNLTSGNSSSFTIGDEMDYGQSVSVAWGATSVDGVNATGSVSYKKVDPNAAITVYVDAPAGTNLYAWGNVGGTEVKLNGAWPGKTLQDKTEVNGTEYYYFTATDVESFNIILNDGSGKTPDITGISEDTYFKYNGGADYEKVEVQDVPVRKNIGVNISPAGGSFKTDTQTVTLSLTKDAVSGWYQVTGQGRKELTKGKTTTLTIGEGVDYGKTIVIDWKAKGDDGTEKTGTASFKKVAPAEGINVYVTGSGASNANLYIWGNSDGKQVEPNGGWPGGKITETEDIEGVTYYCYTVENLQEFNMILNDGSGQTEDIKGIKDTTYVKYEGGGNYTLSSVPFGGNVDPIDPIDPVEPTGDCVVYFDNSGMHWPAVTIHYWGGSSASQWPGVAMKQLSCGHYYYSIPKNSTGIVFNHPNDENMQSDDITPVHGTIYKVTGNKSSEIVGTHNCVISGVETIYSADEAPAELYNLQGVKVTNPGPGLYIVVKGDKSNKIVIR
ncbi:MAG: starch-binding protein, partial [Muribaculaceae bacterium]|nr:starch-binding protein [Muribaculaceae bacterium]